uniref:OSJNBa0079F16.15 protein n=1 Tax=Oryza sativa subsp. japonica TaxID=39947 RepID=Q7XX09_ORYSJ|nr:OSJNBa0079F16.15 [Oryza sativa Japonica Group]
MELDIASDDRRKPPPQMRMAIESSLIHSSRALQSTLHLVDNGGELILVQRMLWPDHYAHDDGSYRTKRSRKYEAWRVDFDAGILVPVKGFNWRALFISMSRAISVSAETLPFVAADTIYFGYCGNLERYSLADGSIERLWTYTLRRVQCNILPREWKQPEMKENWLRVSLFKKQKKDSHYKHIALKNLHAAKVVEQTSSPGLMPIAWWPSGSATAMSHGWTPTKRVGDVA